MAPGETDTPAAQWRWEDVPECPLCGHSERLPFPKYVIDAEHSFVRCLGCDVLYLAPRPVYDAEFVVRNYEDDEGISADQVQDFQRRSDNYYRVRDLLLQAERILGRKGSLLDVGCNRGQLLRAASDLAWQARGVDLSEHFVNAARSSGFDASCEDITLCSPGDTRYDLVVASHVIEHTPDPVVFLQALKERVKPGGIIAVDVPNILAPSLRLKRSLARIGLRKYRIHTPHHLFEFTEASFRNLAAAHSLDVVACFTYSRHRKKPGAFKSLYQGLLKRLHIGTKFRFFLRLRPR